MPRFTAYPAPRFTTKQARAILNAFLAIEDNRDLIDIIDAGEQHTEVHDGHAITIRKCRNTIFLKVGGFYTWTNKDGTKAAATIRCIETAGQGLFN
jgi:hypothetical protein